MGWRYSPGDPRNVYFVSAILSCSLALCVLITYVLFPRLQGKLFMKIITLISLCDFIANATVIKGEPDDRTMCALQGILQQFFYPASWVWTVIMTYLLYCLVMRGKITMPEWQMHVICWGIPLLCTLIPLSTDTYGSQANDDDWCWIQPRTLSNRNIQMNNIWEYITFDCVIFGSFLLMTTWGSLIFYRLTIQQISTTKTIQSALKALIMYPIILFITWCPNAILLTMDIESSMGSPLMLVVNSLSIWQGGLTAIIFFVNSRESRAHWINLFRVMCGYRCACQKGRSDSSTVGHNQTSPAHSATLSSSVDSSMSGFIRRLRSVDRTPLTSASSAYGSGAICEDFESDDTYYGRTSIVASSRVTSTGTGPALRASALHTIEEGDQDKDRATSDDLRESSIAMNEFKNPLH